MSYNSQVSSTSSASKHSYRLDPPTGQAIEAFSDLLADAIGLGEVGETALQFTLETIGRESGILLVQTLEEIVPVSLSHRLLPADWSPLVEDYTSPLFQIARQVMQSGRFLGGDEAGDFFHFDGLAAAIPISARSGIQGVLLIHGTPCSPVEIDWLNKLSRPLGRAIRMSRTGSGGIDNSQPQPVRSTYSVKVTHGLQQDQPASTEDQVMKDHDIVNEAVFQSLIKNLPGCLYLIDREFRLLELSPSISRLIGQDRNSLLGQKCFSAFYYHSEPCAHCLVDETFAKGQPTLRTVIRQNSLNDFINWKIHSFPVYGKDHSVILAILHEQDVSERYYLESQVAQAEKLTALGQLAVGLAHEINNPLTVILANAQILQRELPAGDARLESVELIGIAGARAARLVRNLLDFSRKEPPQHQLIDINDSLRFALTLIQHELAERSINLLFIPEDHLPSILANLESLEGVWLNLFLNAIDSIDKIPGALQVSTHHLDDELHIVVKDNGRGIPQDKLGRVFEPFYTTKPAGKGTGLGLSVCRQVIEQYQGSIQVRSQVGKGSEFEVILPIMYSSEKAQTLPIT